MKEKNQRQDSVDKKVKYPSLPIIICNIERLKVAKKQNSITAK